MPLINQKLKQTGHAGEVQTANARKFNEDETFITLIHKKYIVITFEPFIVSACRANVL